MGEYKSMEKHVVSKENQIRSIAFIVIIMAITLYVVLRGYSLHEIVSVIIKVHPFYLIAGVFLMVFYTGCQAFNLNMILKTLGQPIPYPKCMQYAYIGYYFGSITPSASGGQPAQMYYMNKDKVRVAYSSIAIFFMIFVSQITLILLAGVLSIIRYPIAWRFAMRLKYLLLGGTIVTVGLIIILFVIMFFGKTVPFFLTLFVKLLEKLHLVKKPEEFEYKLQQSLISYREKAMVILKHPVLFVKVLGVSIIEWSTFCTISYLVYLSLGLRVHDIFDLMTCQSLLNVAVTAVPLPGSVGVAEKAFMDIFGEFYTADILPSAMILNRILNFYLPLFISFIVYLFAHIRIMRAYKHEKEV